MNKFIDSLHRGRLGESLIAGWFKAKGYNVLPVYEIEIGNGKGPQLFMSNGEGLIAPDLFVFNHKKTWWIEAKHKSAFTWHRNSKEWTTGIDIKHYNDYLKISKRTPWPVWLMFLQRNGRAKDTPENMVSPTGLYGGDIEKLLKREHHRSNRHGNSGMVYWSEKDLIKLAELDGVLTP